MERLGKNLGGYFGELIDIQRILSNIEIAAAAKHWTREANFLAYHRTADPSRAHVYVSAGIHGDEPAGPMAALRLMEEDHWPADVSMTLCPCLNPRGLALNRRENAEGIDLNRDYRHFQSAECRAHADWIQRQPRFDVSLCLHEDWESSGFYLYELNPDNKPSLAEKIIDAVAKVCPVDMSPVIETWPAQGGIIRPNIDPAERPNWPEAMYLITHKTRQSYTLEAPSDFSLETRIRALRAAVETVVAAL